MGKFTPILNSFTKGQLSKWLKGRSDLEAFYQGAETMRGVLSRPYGGFLLTPGTEFIYETKTSAKESRLIPFIFSVSQAYAIEMGELYFRFYVDGGILESAGTPVEVVSPYDDTEVDDIHFAQSQDVLYLAHSSYTPRKLSRTAPTSWSLDTEAFIGGPFLEDNTTAVTINPSGTTGAITLTASSATFNADHVGALWKVAGVVSGVQGHVRITAFTSSTLVSATVITTLSATGATTAWAEGAWSDYRGWPSRVVFHEGRIWYAATDAEPQKVWGSQPFIYNDFTPGSDDDSAVERELPTRQLNKIQWLSSENLLIVGTTGGEFTIGSGSSAEAITPANIVAKNRTVWGSESVQPARIGNRTYYVQREGRKVREFYYDFQIDNYQSNNTTLFSEDITSDKIVQISLQQNEDNILWCVLDDGRLATLTREVEQSVTGWTYQETDGLYESVCAIPRYGQYYDDVYVIVKRTINGSTKRYVELFREPRSFSDQRRLWYVHCGLRYDGFQNTEDESATLTLSATSGTSVTATSSVAWFTAANIGDRIQEVDADGNIVGEGIITAYTSTTVVTIEVTDTFSSTSISAGSWARSTHSISGLSHLEAGSVSIVADGAVLANETVSAGAITLDNDYFIITVGLYDEDYGGYVKLFPLEGGATMGTSQGKSKRINNIIIRFIDSGGVIVSNGEEDQQLFFIQPGTELGDAPALYTGDKTTAFRDFNNPNAQIIIKQPVPLPMNIIAIMPEVVTYEK